MFHPFLQKLLQHYTLWLSSHNGTLLQQSVSRTLVPKVADSEQFNSTISLVKQQLPFLITIVLCTLAVRHPLKVDSFQCPNVMLIYFFLSFLKRYCSFVGSADNPLLHQANVKIIIIY